MVSILKSNLEKEIFRIKGDRLVHVLQLANLNEEDLKNYLCISVSATNDVCLTWLTVTEKKTVFKYESMGTWLLKDLALIDGVDHSQDNALFSLHFHTEIYTLEAYSTASKYAFLRCLRKMSTQYLQRELQWINFDNDFVGKTSLLVPDDAVLYVTLCIKIFSCACLCSCF
ncbi:exocyst complex component 1-like [Mantella aurantiaca]